MFNLILMFLFLGGGALGHPKVYINLVRNTYFYCVKL